MSFRRHLCGAVLGVVLAACANQMVPAQQAISEISARLSAISAEARQYVPERLAAVQAELAALKARFDSKDYAGVVGGAPAVMREAQEVGAAAAAQKAVVTAALNARWAALADALPADAAVIQARIDALQQASGTRKRAGIDLNAARATLSEQRSVWSKSQAAFAIGNLTEAVAIGERLEGRYQALAASLRMRLPPGP